MGNCHYCKRKLDNPEDPTTVDCGGDCVKCMAEIAGDPDCVAEMERIKRCKVGNGEQHLYAVFREGVYRHECLGVFNHVLGAIKTADLAADRDHDSHHSYDVTYFEINKTTMTGEVEHGPFAAGPVVDEPNAIYSVRKGDDAAKRSVAKEAALSAAHDTEQDT